MTSHKHPMDAVMRGEKSVADIAHDAFTDATDPDKQQAGSDYYAAGGVPLADVMNELIRRPTRPESRTTSRARRRFLQQPDTDTPPDAA